MSHTSKTCCSCQQSFAPGDDVVICPECGAPYHRACYQKEGGCLYTAQHAEGFEHPSSPSAQAHSSHRSSAEDEPTGRHTHKTDAGGGVMACALCGTENDINHIFCEKCGSPLHTSAPRPPFYIPPMPGNENEQSGVQFFSVQPVVEMDEEVDGIPLRDWAVYFGSPFSPYLHKLTQQKRRGSYFSVVASAFFLGPLYFAYRKMWGWAVLATALWVLISIPPVLDIMAANSNPLVSGLPSGLLDILMQVSSFLWFATQLFSGFFAMALYRKDAGKKIRSLREKYANDTEYRNAIAAKGGVSMLGVVLVMVAVLALNMLAYPYIEADILRHITHF